MSRMVEAVADCTVTVGLVGGNINDGPAIESEKKYFFTQHFRECKASNPSATQIF